MRFKHVPLGLVGAIALASSLAAPSAADARFGDASLHRGDSGRNVKVLQRWMTRVGVETPIDGSFGPRTYRSVRKYEQQFDLRVDGKVSRSQAAGLRKRAYAAAENASKIVAAPRSGGVEAGEKLPEQALALTDGPKAVLSDDGKTALAPASAPQAVKDAIEAANRLVDKPYIYGGGHGRVEDRGYDCSGTISYALIHAGLLKAPLASGGFYGYGKSGKGEWITVYTNEGHMYAIIAGLRLDTSGPGEKGPRWRPESRSSSGFKVRHPAGL